MAFEFRTKASRWPGLMDINATCPGPTLFLRGSPGLESEYKGKDDEQQKDPKQIGHPIGHDAECQPWNVSEWSIKKVQNE
jgi:hypothetical protein